MRLPNGGYHQWHLLSVGGSVLFNDKPLQFGGVFQVSRATRQRRSTLLRCWSRLYFWEKPTGATAKKNLRRHWRYATEMVIISHSTLGCAPNFSVLNIGICWISLFLVISCILLQSLGHLIWEGWLKVSHPPYGMGRRFKGPHFVWTSISSWGEARQSFDQSHVLLVISEKKTGAFAWRQPIRGHQCEQRLHQMVQGVARGSAERQTWLA